MQRTAGAEIGIMKRSSGCARPSIETAPPPLPAESPARASAAPPSGRGVSPRLASTLDTAIPSRRDTALGHRDPIGPYLQALLAAFGIARKVMLAGVRLSGPFVADTGVSDGSWSPGSIANVRPFSFTVLLCSLSAVSV